MVFDKQYRAVVVNPVDAKGRNKVQIKCDGIMEGIPDDALPWAEFLLPLNYRYTPLLKGDLVWVDFPYNGDSRRPRIIGGAQDWKGDGKANVPAEAGGKSSELYKPATGENIPAWAKSQPPQVDDVLARNKLLEVRTVGGGYQITNIDTGATVGFNEAGDLILIAKGRVYIAGENGVIETSGNMLMKIGGKFDLEVAGDMTQTSAKLTVTAKGAWAQKAASADVNISGSYTFKASSASYSASTFAFKQ